MEDSANRETIRHLEEAVRLNPGRARYAGLLGEALLRERDLEAALPHLLRAGRDEPTPHNLQILAIALLEKGRFGEAEAVLTQLIEEAPLVHRGWYLRARVRSRLRRDADALEDLREALSLAPGKREYLLAVGRVLLEAPRPLEHSALSWGARAFREVPVDDAESAFLHAGLLLAQGRHAEATPHLRRLVDTTPWHALAMELVNSEGAACELPWPDPLDADSGLLPDLPRIVSFATDPDPRIVVDNETANQPTSSASSTRSRLFIGELLQEGRRLLQRDPEAAAQRLCRALRLVEESNARGDSGVMRLQAGICEELSRVEGDGLPSLEELYHGGARSPEFLHRVTSELLARGRRDLVALEIFVTALECEALRDATLHQRLLGALQEGLRVTLGSSLNCVRPRIPLLERLRALQRPLAFPSLYLGLIHYLGRDFAGAHRLFSEIPGRTADGARLLFLRGRCAEKLGRHDEALDLYRRSLGARPAQCHAHFRIGRILLARRSA